MGRKPNTLYDNVSIEMRMSYTAYVTSLLYAETIQKCFYTIWTL